QHVDVAGAVDLVGDRKLAAAGVVRLRDFHVPTLLPVPTGRPGQDQPTTLCNAGRASSGPQTNAILVPGECSAMSFSTRSNQSVVFSVGGQEGLWPLMTPPMATASWASA
ncbi:MAG: hypothetical protein ACXVFN_10260, partial [Solirubrobacteraceae bacterium]